MAATSDIVSSAPSPPTVEGPARWSIERVVALATPVFAGVGGLVFSVLAKYVPGVNIPQSDFVWVFVSGGTLATTAALTWLFGRQKFVHFVLGAEQVTDHVAKAVQTSLPQGLPQLRQIQAALEAHEASVVEAVGKTIGLPPSADEVAQQIVGQLLQHQPAPPAPQAPTTTG